MITAILSDIHSNLEALTRVCEHAGAHGAGRYVCLGDFVGYGADPNPTLARVMALPGLVAVRGNHDEALFREDMTGGTYPDILAALAWTRDRLTPAQRAFLAGLPLLHRELPSDGDAHDSRDGGRSGLLPSRGTTPSLEGGGTTSGTKEVGGVGNEPPRATAASDVPVSRGTRASCTSPGAVAESASGARGGAGQGSRLSATFVHASAHQPADWDYLYAPEQIHACLEDAGTQLTFIGHVHVPRVFYEMPGTEAANGPSLARGPRLNPIGDVREFDPPDGVPIPLSPYRRYVINVGSVGQPRDGNNAACYVLYDDEAAELTFHRLAYDYVTTAAKIRAAGLSPFFAERLAYGR